MSIPLFKSYGAASKDLFKKKYDYDYTVKTSNTVNNVTLTSGVVLPAGGAYRGFVSGKFSKFATDSVFKGATATFDVTTDASVDSSVSIQFPNVKASGVSVKLTTNTRPAEKVFTRPAFSADVTYTAPNVVANLLSKTDLDSTRLDGSLSVGYNNISVGGAATVDVSRGAELIEQNIGGQYATKDFVASIYTEKNSSVLTTSYWEKLSAVQSIGAQLKFDLTGKQERSFGFGTVYRLDANTDVRAKVELPSGDVAAQIEHRLADPHLLLSVATQFNAKSQTIQADKLGVSVTFGDY